MGPMQPGAQAPQAAAAPAKPQAGGAQALVSDIHEKMATLGELMAKSPAVSPDDKAKYASLMQGFESFIEELSQPPGAKAPQAPQPGGPAPMEAGANPNVRQAL